MNLIPAISLVIMKGNKIFEKGYGFIDRENAIPASPSSIYPIGSISKQFTAAAIMKLVEEKKLKLDDPVGRYLPEYRVLTRPTLLIRHLSQQKSGIPEWNDLPEMEAFYTTNVDSFTLTKIISILGHQQQLYAPGSWWSYSNSIIHCLLR
jgi:CubicO group peptidase (beta-lactamase class C family)